MIHTKDETYHSGHNLALCGWMRIEQRSVRKIAQKNSETKHKHIHNYGVFHAAWLLVNGWPGLELWRCRLLRALDVVLRESQVHQSVQHHAFVHAAIHPSSVLTPVCTRDKKKFACQPQLHTLTRQFYCNVAFVCALFCGSLRSKEPPHHRGRPFIFLPPGIHNGNQGPLPVSYTHLTLPTNREV